MSKPDKRVGGGAVTAAPKRSGPPKGGPKHDKSGGKNRDGGSKRDGGGGKAATASGGKGKPAAPPPAAPPATRKERKQLSEQRKLATKKHYGTIAETVRLWEAARPRANSAEQRAKLADDVARRFLGKAQDLATHHSASRVLQFALRELPAGSKLRTSLVAEVRTAAVPLARSKYGKHVVQRLIAHAARGGGGSADGKAELDALVRAFRGHVVELMRHPHGADVLLDLYDAATPAQRNALASEAYGREFVLLGETGASGDTASLSHVRVLLDRSDASKRRAVVAAMQRALEPVLEKGLLHPPLTHRLLREYLEVAPGSLVAEAVDTLAATGGNALKMVHTADGAAACCAAFCYGTARDRKRLIKGMKGYVAQTASNEHAHAVVSAALTVTDDTALTGKVIMGELKAHLQELLVDKHGSRPLLAVLAPDGLPRYVSTAALAAMRPPARTQRVAASSADGGKGGGAESDEEAEDDVEGGKKKKQQPKKQKKQDEEGDEEEEGGGANAKEEVEMVERPLGESKKDPEARRRELLGAGGFGAALVALVREGASGLLRLPAGCDVVAEVARGAQGGLLWQSQREAVEAVHAAIVEAAAAGVLGSASGGGKQAEEKQQEDDKPKKKQKQQQPKQQKEQDECGDGCGHDHGDAHEDDQTPLLSHYYASRALRRLALASREPGAGGDGARAFVARLWDGALKGQGAALAATHAAKVLAAVATGGDARVCEEARAELAGAVADVDEWARRFVGGKESGGGGGGGGGGGAAAAKKKTQPKPSAATKGKRKAAA